MPLSKFEHLCEIRTDPPDVRRRLRERDYAVSKNGVSVRICRWDKLAVAISFGINFAGWLAPPS